MPLTKAHELVAPLFEPSAFAKCLGAHSERRPDAAPVNDEIQLTEKRPLLTQEVAPKAVAAGVDVAKLEHVHAHDRSGASRRWKALGGREMSACLPCQRCLAPLPSTGFAD